MIIKCKTMKDCREALYKAYEEDENAVLDLNLGIDASKVPIMVGACTQCNADKVFGKLNIDTQPTSCLVCGEEMDWDHVIDMIIQEDIVVYRCEESY